MANSPGHILTDINVYSPNKALAGILMGEDPRLEAFLLVLGTKKAIAYSAKVAKKTGRLGASPVPQVVVGGHKHDRLVSKVTVAGTLPANTWKGKPFYYGVLHNFGSPTKRAQFPAHNDLKEVMQVND